MVGLAKFIGINFQEFGWEVVPILITQLIRLALEVAAILSVLYMIIGAYHYLFAFGNDSRVTKGKTIMTWAIIGVIVCTLSFVIVTEVWNLFSNQPLPPILH